MSMTKKDYEMVAKVIRRKREEFYSIDHESGIGGQEGYADTIALSLADSFSKDNKDFKRDLFLKQCGVEI